MSDDVPSKRIPLPGSHGSVRPSARAPSSMPVSQSAARESDSVNDDDWDSPAPESSEQRSAASTPPSQMPESSQRRVEAGAAARETSQPPDSVERPSDPSRTPTVRVSTRPQAIAQAEAGSFDGLKEGLPRGTDDRTTLMGIAPFGQSSTPPVRPVSSTPPPATTTPSNRPYVWPQLPPEVVAAQKALAAQARAEGAVRDDEPTKTTEPVGQPERNAAPANEPEQGEPRHEVANKEASKTTEVIKQEAFQAVGAQTTPPRNRRIATTDDAAFDASDRSSAPKPSRSKPKIFIAAAVVLGAVGLWAAGQSSGTKSSSESENAVAQSKGLTETVPIKPPAPASQPVRESAQQATAAMEVSPPPAPTPQPVSAELPVKPEAAAAAATQAPTAEEAPSSGPTTQVVIRSKTKGAKFYRFGKEIGTDEITVDLPAGEKRAFELGLPGHATRKIVVDGTSTEIEVGLRKIEGKPGSLTPKDL